MPDEAPDVKVRIRGEDDGSVGAAIKALSDRLAELKKQQKDTADSSVELKNALGAIISSAIVLKVVEFGKEVFQATLNVERMSQRTGISASTLSVYAKAAESSGLSTEQMNTAVTRLASSVTRFEQGGTQAAAAFKALNLTQSDFKNLSPDEKIRLVTDRLGGMKDGFLKADTARQLFGRGGAALIPTLQSLAGDGFDKVTEAAQKSGQFLTDQMAADAAGAAAAMNELEGAGKGIATQFEAGLLPALIDVADAMTDNVEEGGTSAFKELGRQAGEVIKTLVLAWEIGTSVIGAGVLSLGQLVVSIVAEMVNAIVTLGVAAYDAAHLQFKAAGGAIAAGVKNGVDLAKQSLHELGDTWGAVGDTIAKGSANLFKTPEQEAALAKERAAKFKPAGGGGEEDIEDDKATKARLALLEARLQNELALFKANNSEKEAENQSAYDRGLISLKTYFDKRRTLAQAEAAEQISVLSRQRALVQATPTAGTDAEEIAKRQKLAAIDNQIAVAKVQASQKQTQLDAQEFTAADSHNKKLLDFQAQILTAQGLTYQAALAQIQGEEAALTRSLVQAGLSPEKVAAMVSQIQQLKLSTAEFDEQKRAGEVALKSLANDKDDINLKAEQGLISQAGAELRIQEIERARIPILLQIAAAMERAAITPEQKQAAADFAQEVARIGAAANVSGQQMAKLKDGAINALGSNLTTFLGSTIDQVHGVGDAFRQLGSSVLASLQQVVAQILVTMLMTKLLKSALGGALGFSGGGLVSGGAVAAAGGGLVTGPGTATSDSIPASLSNGEFVVRAAAVQAIGVPELQLMNRLGAIPAAVRSLGAIPRFAEGGLVGGEGSSGYLGIGIGLDEGLILKHLKSKAAQRIVLEHISNNPKAANRALQRGHS